MITERVASVNYKGTDNDLIIEFHLWLYGSFVSHETNLVVTAMRPYRLHFTKNQIREKARYLIVEAQDDYTKQYFNNIIKNGTTYLPDTSSREGIADTL